MTRTPYKLLDYYRFEDADLFFGREEETRQMVGEILSTRLLVLFSPSGSGKTSLINCGLANKFEESDWLPINIRRGSDIVKSLLDELNKVSIAPSASISAQAKESKKRITKLLQSIYLDHFKPIYLIFDQFEELFIFGDRQEREEFVGIVKFGDDDRLVRAGIARDVDDLMTQPLEDLAPLGHFQRHPVGFTDPEMTKRDPAHDWSDWPGS